ncbi:MAG: hypothetical protein IPO83_03310 [Chitinophagaceae bacterium]|nr:hypothetical protein [Chitinophagaceae bacterium]
MARLTKNPSYSTPHKCPASYPMDASFHSRPSFRRNLLQNDCIGYSKAMSSLHFIRMKNGIA